MKNDRFWSEIGSGFGEPGGAHPPKNSQEYPPSLSGPEANSPAEVFCLCYSMIAFHTNLIPCVLSCDYFRLLISNRLVHFHK